MIERIESPQKKKPPSIGGYHLFLGFLVCFCVRNPPKTRKPPHEERPFLHLLCVSQRARWEANAPENVRFPRRPVRPTQVLPPHRTNDSSLQRRGNVQRLAQTWHRARLTKAR